MNQQTGEDFLRTQIESLSKRLESLEESIKNLKEMGLPVENESDKIGS